MFATTRSARILLHLANLLAIFFILLPVVATAIGALQSEKSLQADTRRVLPPEYTLDNFTLILSKGEQKGRIFEQATYLPENIKHFYAAFSNSVIVSLSGTCPPRRAEARRGVSRSERLACTARPPTTA